MYNKEVSYASLLYEMQSQEGYKDAKNGSQIWYFCDQCGEKIVITPDSNAHEAIIGFMKEQGWGHNRCHEKR